MTLGYTVNFNLISSCLVHGFNFQSDIYEGWNFNSGNYLFTTDTK